MTVVESPGWGDSVYCKNCGKAIGVNEDMRWTDVAGEVLCQPLLGTGPEALIHEPPVEKRKGLDG